MKKFSRGDILSLLFLLFALSFSRASIAAESILPQIKGNPEASGQVSSEDIKAADSVLPSRVGSITLDGMSFSRTSGSYGVGNSDPTWIDIYHPYRWSTSGYWDLRNKPSIPAGAVITGVKLSWGVFPGYGGWSGMHVALFDEVKGFYWPQNNVTTGYFNGHPAKQMWSCKFWVASWNRPGYPLSISPKLTIFWSR